MMSGLIGIAIHLRAAFYISQCQEERNEEWLGLTFAYVLKSKMHRADGSNSGCRNSLCISHTNSFSNMATAGQKKFSDFFKKAIKLISCTFWNESMVHSSSVPFHQVTILFLCCPGSVEHRMGEAEV